MGINSKQLIENIIQPTLKDMGFYSLAAEQLIAGTCAQESGMGTYLAQIKGDALGIYQMEVPTYEYLCGWMVEKGHWKLGANFAAATVPPSDMLIYNLRFATRMCRAKYLTIAQPLPEFNDLQAMANYWKTWYNTPEGAGTPEQFIANFKKYLSGYYQEAKY